MDTWLLWFLGSITVVVVAAASGGLTRFGYKRKLRKLSIMMKSGHKERVNKIIDKFLGEE